MKNETGENGANTAVRLSKKGHERELARLHVELVKLQEWVKYKGLKVCIGFEWRCSP